MRRVNILEGSIAEVAMRLNSRRMSGRYTFRTRLATRFSWQAATPTIVVSRRRAMREAWDFRHSETVSA
jgi:hypothetical protein